MPTGTARPNKRKKPVHRSSEKYSMKQAREERLMDGRSIHTRYGSKYSGPISKIVKPKRKK